MFPNWEEKPEGATHWHLRKMKFYRYDGDYFYALNDSGWSLICAPHNDFLHYFIPGPRGPEAGMLKRIAYLEAQLAKYKDFYLRTKKNVDRM